MSTATFSRSKRAKGIKSPSPAGGSTPRLLNGDHWAVPEFERRYWAMPEIKKAELIEGIVVMSPPASNTHGEAHGTVNHLRFRSASETKIAATLDKVHGVWFLPNCRGRFGAPEDRKNREADFLVCHKGKWGILEPQNRYSSTRCRCRRERERNLPKSCWPAWKRRLGLPKSRLPAIGKPWNDARPPTKANSSKRRRRMCPTTQIEKLGEAGRLPPMRTEIQSRRHSPKKSEKIAANPRVLADLQ